MDFNTLEEAMNAKHAMETMAIEEQQNVSWPKVNCKYPMPQWPGQVCDLHHLTEEHEAISERCKQANIAAAKRLLERFPNDAKLKEALKGWVTNEQQEKGQQEGIADKESI